MLWSKLWGQPQIIYAKICFKNQKCFRFYRTKEDFEHSDPLERVLGPAEPDYKPGYCFHLWTQGRLMVPGCQILPAMGSLES